MKDKTRLTCSAQKSLPNFIKSIKLPSDRELTELEIAFVKSYLLLISSPTQSNYTYSRIPSPEVHKIPSYIKLALFTKDLDFVDEIIQNGIQICVDSLQHVPSYNYVKSFTRNFTSVFTNLLELAKEYPEYGILNGIRSFCSGVVEVVQNYVDVPKNDYRYLLVNSAYTSKCCYCKTCLILNDFLDSEDISFVIRVSNTDHILEEFYNDKLEYKVAIDESLKNLLTITSKPWRDKFKVTITKKPLIPKNVQPMVSILPVIEELLAQVPSTRKSARKRIPLPLEEEPPAKVQKIE